MKLKSFFLLIVVILGSLFFIEPKTQAEEVRTISYQLLKTEQKNAVPAEPVELTIPSAKIQASIEKVGLVGDKMDVPKKPENVGWYEYSYRPGEKGNAVLAGHFDTSEGEPAVFWKLGLLRPNDTIYVTDTEGKKYTFAVSDIQEYPYKSVPLTTLFTKSLTQNLVLITCSGEYNNAEASYSKRLVVTAKLVQE